MKKFSVFFLFLMTLGLLIPSYGQTVFNCSSGFASSGSCGVGSNGTGGYAFQLAQDPTGVLSGSDVNLIPVGSDGGGHAGAGLIYQTAVNAQAFTTTFTFVPNGKNIAFVITNNTSHAANSTNPQYFAGGAGCEAGFFQAFTVEGDTTYPLINNIFALELDQFSALVNNGSNFTYSSAMIYQTGQSPCIPPYDGTYGEQPAPSKVSTSPVPLNNPASTPLTTTGDTYSVTITYDGSNVTLNLYDITAGGACPGSNCFSYTWSGVNIPSLIGANTGYTGIVGGTNSDAVDNLLVKSFTYTEGSTTSTPPTVSTPTFAPAPGTYTSAQTVTISDSTSGAAIYYTTNGTTPTTSSTQYTGPIAVSATETLQAVAAAPGETSSAIASAAYTISSQSTPPTKVSTPTLTPPAGPYTSAQSVTMSDATSGATIYYTTDRTTPTSFSTPYTGPITVSATETLQAIAVAVDDSNSAIASASYTITSQSTSSTVSTPTFTPPAGTFISAQWVTLSDATAGATIYYTTDETTPTTSSTQYSGPIAVGSTETLQAIAVETGDTNSAVASAAYTIPLQPGFLLSTSLPSLTVNSGGQSTLTLTVTPENGFDSPVTFACSGLPSGATCSFDQETVTPSGEATTAQLTIFAGAQTAAMHPESRPFFPLTVVAVTACFMGWQKRRGTSHWLFSAIAFASLGVLLGCGIVIRGSLTAPVSGTSTVTVMATSGTLQQKVSIALTVN